jgi:hypothetical protein
MKEEFLHYLWKSKRFENQLLSLTDGRMIKVADTGYHNSETGPDFFNGSIELDGLQWTGNIEIHVKSSDWIKHGHQSDGRYDNVILHVVYHHDREIAVNDRILPVLELKELIPDSMVKNYAMLQHKNPFIHCAAMIQPNQEAWKKQLGLAIFQRMERKSAALIAGNYDVNSSDRRRQFLVAIATGFGMKVNKLPFQELATRIPFNRISSDKQLMNAALVFGISGLLDHDQVNKHTKLHAEWLFLKHKYDLESMNHTTWKFGGVRPSNSPWLMLVQFIRFLSHWNQKDLADESLAQMMQLMEGALSKPLNKEIENEILECIPISRLPELPSKNLKNLVLINGVVPYLNYLKSVYGNFQAGDVAFELLHHLKPDQNSVLKNWKKIGIEALTAADSQALIEQKSRFCDQNRCLDCLLGQEFMERKQEIYGMLNQFSLDL